MDPEDRRPGRKLPDVSDKRIQRFFKISDFLFRIYIIRQLDQDQRQILCKAFRCRPVRINVFFPPKPAFKRFHAFRMFPSASLKLFKGAVGVMLPDFLHDKPGVVLLQGTGAHSILIQNP